MNVLVRAREGGQIIFSISLTVSVHTAGLWIITVLLFHASWEEHGLRRCLVCGQGVGRA